MLQKVLLATVLVVALAGFSHAQTVTFTLVFETSTDVGASAFCSAYNPGNDTFISAPGGQSIVELSGTTGALTGTSYNMTGVDIGGLGVFGIGAGTDGTVYGVDNAGVLRQWASGAAVASVTAATGVIFTRNMTVHGTGANTKVSVTGDGDTGAIDIYTTSDGTNFTLFDSVPTIAKSGHTVNAALTTAYGVGDINSPIIKKDESGGSWIQDASFTPDSLSDGCGPMWLDEVNNILLVSEPGIDTVVALNAASGVLAGTDVYTDDLFTTPGYNGGYASSVAGSGTFWFAQRGPSTAAHVGKYTYTVTSSVDDWTLY